MFNQYTVKPKAVVFNNSTLRNVQKTGSHVEQISSYYLLPHKSHVVRCFGLKADLNRFKLNL